MLTPCQRPAQGARAQTVHPPPWCYPSPPKGSLPRLLQQGQGDAETCLSSRMEGKGSANTSIRAWAGTAASPAWRGHEKPAWKGQTTLHKCSPGLSAWEVHQHLPKGCHYPARCTTKIQTHSVCSFVSQPLALIPTHRIRLFLLPYPQDKAVYPRHSPQGCGTSAALPLLQGEPPPWHGTACRRCELCPTTPWVKALMVTSLLLLHIESWQRYWRGLHETCL